jgi:electron transfer flavoprotein alpha/beta subunit
MGADELVLVQDPAIDDSIDSRVTAQLLSAAIKKLGARNRVEAARLAEQKGWL